jgi:general secretion pathway protein E
MGQIVDSIGLADDLTDEEQIQHLKDLASEAPVIRLVNLMIAARGGIARVRHPHRTVREPAQGALPGRRRAARGGIAALRFHRGGDLAASRSWPSSTSPSGACRRTAHHVARAGQGTRPARVHRADLYGESVVMRILDRASVVLDFQTLGFTANFLPQVPGRAGHAARHHAGHRPHRHRQDHHAVHRAANHQHPGRKIITVEDPVEYQLEGVNQIQVKPQINLTFANALRAIVRQDPDIIMIGEMRDLETAGIAVQSALTGHLVLSTLHTNDAAGSITRCSTWASRTIC